MMTSESKTIWKVDFNELAKQICLKDMELFKAISIEEIDSFDWTKNNKKSNCPNLMISNKQFNKINLWVQKEILDQQISLVGIKILSRFINLSKRLLDLRNFQSAYAVKSALHSGPIFRLEYLWSEISKKDKLVWEKLLFVFNVEDNYHNLRNAMTDSKKPSIPFIGVYLSDLTGLDAAYPKDDGVVPEPRKIASDKIYTTIKHFQSSKYNFKLHPGIQEYLHSMEYMEEFQNLIIDNLFHLSKARELSIPTQNSNTLKLQAQFIRNGQFHPSHRKCRSLEAHDQGIYRKISDNERESVFVPSPDSPTMMMQNKNDTTSVQLKNIRNLLDDSVVEINLDPHYSPGSSIGQNGSLRGTSPIMNNYHKWDDSQRKSEVDTLAVLQYTDPDIVAINQQLKMVAEGSVKRKVKMKCNTFCMPSYQKVLVKLLMNCLDCYLCFHTPKVSKPKVIGDFREESHMKISLTSAHLNYKKITFNPKIIITTPHEIYVLKSVDDVGEDWPTIDYWWKVINESIVNVTSSRNSCTQLQQDLINLNDDFTRL